MNDEDEVFGVPVKTWKQGFRPGMPEFAASNFIFSAEPCGMIRIAFGNLGPYVNKDGARESVFTHAVTLPDELAVDLARHLLKHYAEPVERRRLQSAG